LIPWPNTHFSYHKVHNELFIAGYIVKRLLPLKSTPESTDEGATVLSISEEAADDVFETLSSTTARRILSLLYEEPRPASDLATETETTVQNVRYHLDNLQEADLISVVDTWYSEKGTEMNVYGPTDAAVVLTAGRQSTTDRLKSTIRELLGAVGIFALASVVVQYLATTRFSAPTDDTAESPTATEEPEPVPESEPETPAVEMDRDAAEPAAESTLELLVGVLGEPGVVFFSGCLLALFVVVLVSRRR